LYDNNVPLSSPMAVEFLSINYSDVRSRQGGSMPATGDRRLYLGDNLEVLRGGTIPPNSVDLIYLDPPFNSNRAYNMLFAEHDMSATKAQIKAFEDTWVWDSAAQRAFEDLTVDAQRFGISEKVTNIVSATCNAFPRSDVAAYLVMMAARLVELHRVLKPTGSLYLHCDPTASHYLKMILDAIFGPQNFRSEIIWKRSSAHSDAKQGRQQHGRIHDTLLFYTKSDTWKWKPMYTPYDAAYASGFYKHIEPKTGRRYGLFDITGPGGKAKGNPRFEVMGVTRYWRFSEEKMAQMIREGRVVQAKPGAVPRQKRYLDEMPGVSLQDVWTDIAPLGAQAEERIGYPTQKPLALLERILESSSEPGDLVLDPFCGCGTTIHAAERNGRRWIGIDITEKAIKTIEDRMKKAFPYLKYEFDSPYPVDAASALILAKRSKARFQDWAIRVLGAEHGKMGGDQGIDGKLRLAVGPGRTETAIISVKGGGTGPRDVRDLEGVIAREHAPMGIFFTAEPPTPEMRKEAASQGTVAFEGWGRFPKIQIITVEEWFHGKRIEVPGRVIKAAEVEPPGSRSGENLVLPGIEAPAVPVRRAVIVDLEKEVAREAAKIPGERKGPQRAPRAVKKKGDTEIK
jgi:DNA modification methylase